MGSPVLLRHDDDQPALIDAGTGAVTTHAGLRTLVAEVAGRLGAERGLVFLFADNTIRTVLYYLAALQRGYPVALLDAGLKAELARALIGQYQPETVIYPIGRDPGPLPGYPSTGDGIARRHGNAGPLHPELAVLLSTSGSTGSPKLVRLAAGNVLANAAAIAASLDITRADRAVTNLPLHYSYGMSVLNSHLLAGSSLLVGDADVLEPRFWEAVREHRVTCLPGVPFTYQTLRRIGFASMELPALSTLTQAGGKLDDALVREFADLMRQRGGRFHVMYGQTEAGPRMTCLPAERLPEKLGSAGLPLPGGRIVVRTADGEPAHPGVAGSVCYCGPNVMMGYAHSRADLALGDVHGDTLETGDVGFLDRDGYLFLTGRSTRIAKLFGVRLSLDEVEQLLSRHGPVAVVGTPTDQLAIFCAWGDEESLAAERRRLCRDLRVPLGALRFVRVEALAVLPNGKTDYRALTARATAAGVPA